MCICLAMHSVGNVGYFIMQVRYGVWERMGGGGGGQGLTSSGGGAAAAWKVNFVKYNTF